ncbi:MarR family transcriptional regulator [Sulfitobacter sp. F26204]|uniref:MarR family winged helix-turn-helix transcriptional regulator n=1 Tax=Sulfitobacter sp. F26204 TaxID=2996014 RepID=UPI00225E0B06|nr:MarR family transcriptional regulator [Sulfitobacter sp. F26204]MCX7561444.1 MarR family transcriptional regulator [Sulfitobacter sp. F26204]
MPAHIAFHTPHADWLDQIDPPEQMIVLAARQMQDTMNAVLRRHALKIVEWRILRCLIADEILTICDLSDLAAVDRTVTSRLVDKLAERGLLHKNALKTDRRFAQISLSQAGRQLLEAAEPDVQKARQKLFKDMSSDEVSEMNTTLQKFITNAKLR